MNGCEERIKDVSVVFAGGGTGGHVYPALAVADELRSRIPNFRAVFVGTRSGLEAKVIPEAGYDIKFIFSGGVRGKGFPRRVFTLASIAIGAIQALRILTGFKPDLVFGSGGYASAAVVFAASLCKYTIVLQEQNSVPGLTNRMMAPKAERIYLGFEKAREYLAGHPATIITGNPLRGILTGEYRGEPREEFGLKLNKPVLLVFGGSQGAGSLNRAAVDYFIGQEEVQGIIQTGEKQFGWVKERLRTVGDRVYVSPFISHIHLAYRAADVALARAGALSVSELAAVGLPSILVPYPYATDDHQTRNAAVMVEAGGALTIKDSELSGRTLGDAMARLVNDPELLRDMKLSLGEISRINATELIADDIVAFLAGKGRGGNGGDG